MPITLKETKLLQMLINWGVDIHNTSEVIIHIKPNDSIILETKGYMTKGKVKELTEVVGYYKLVPNDEYESTE